MSFGPTGVLLGPCLVASAVISVKAAARIARSTAAADAALGAHSGRRRAGADGGSGCGGCGGGCGNCGDFGASPPTRPLVATLTSPPTPAPGTITRRAHTTAGRPAAGGLRGGTPQPVRGLREWAADAGGLAACPGESGSFLRELADGYEGVRRSISATGRRISREIDARQWAHFAERQQLSCGGTAEGAPADGGLERARGLGSDSEASGAADDGGASVAGVATAGAPQGLLHQPSRSRSVSLPTDTVAQSGS